jgi:LysM repeat protein
MKIQIPARTASASSSAPVSGGSGVSDDGRIYIVKPGDTLTRIARQHGTTISAIRNANGMRTSRVNAGQKLKLPASTKSGPVKEARTNIGETF